MVGGAEQESRCSATLQVGCGTLLTDAGESRIRMYVDANIIAKGLSCPHWRKNRFIAILSYYPAYNARPGAGE